MSAIKSLVLAIQIAKSKRDVLAAQLKHCKQAMENAQVQMNQLFSYSEETHEKWIITSQAGVSPEIMRHHNQFMARLQEAIALQQKVIKNSEAENQAIRKLFIASELRLASLEHMLKKLQLNLDAHQKRKEQKQTDEFAATKKLSFLETF